MNRMKVAGTLVAIAALLLTAAPTQAAQSAVDSSTMLRFSSADVGAIPAWFADPANIAALSPAMQRYLEANRGKTVNLSRDKPLEKRLTGMIRQVPEDLRNQISPSGPSLRLVMIGRNVVLLQGGGRNLVRDYVSIDRPTRKPRRRR